MTDRYDAAVVGLGAMGSAAAYHLAKRGLRVVGFEQFAMGHDLGASSGRSRIIRKAYFENAAYVPLLVRAYELWRKLEELTHTQLLEMTGVLIAGPPESEVVSGTLHAARLHNLQVECLNASELRERFPAMRVRDAEVGVLEPDAGVVFPEAAVAAHQAAAIAAGAELRDRAAVKTCRKTTGGFVVELQDGDEILTSQIVVCAGPWFGRIAQEQGIRLSVQRNVQYWFEPLSGDFTPDVLPAFLIERPELPGALYGFPDLGDGVKAAFHGVGDRTDPDKLDRDVENAEVHAMRIALGDFLPNAPGELRSFKACMYALTPDHHFVVGHAPGQPGVVLAGGFSGHGFKFAPVIGEMCAQLVTDGSTPYDIAFLSARRFL